jgi:predicted ATPase with chaperone activity
LQVPNLQTKTLRVARTIADLNDPVDITTEDIAEALQYRQQG